MTTWLAVAETEDALETCRLIRRLLLVRCGGVGLCLAVLGDLARDHLSPAMRIVPPLLFFAPPLLVCAMEWTLTRKLRGHLRDLIPQKGIKSL